jgi:carboxylesterase
MELYQNVKPISHTGKSDIGVLISHGFTSTPQSQDYMAKRFADAGFHVECPILPGHCTKWQDLNKVSYTQWIDTLYNSLDALRQRASFIVMEGLSMGGTLTLYFAQNYPDIKAAAVVNHALWLGSPLIPLSPALKYIMPSTPAIAGDIKDPSAREYAYTRTPIGGVAQLWKLAKKVIRDHDKIKVPLMIFKSEDDHVLPRKNAEFTYQNAASGVKELIWLKNSFHVATLDYDKDFIADKTIEFFRNIREKVGK